MPSPLCRCRVLYVGSAVPTATKDGLQGIQEPLREQYPVNRSADTKGIDSWLSVWSNGLLLEYIEEPEKRTRAAFFPIKTLHYCAAVRYVNVAGYDVDGRGDRFLPLDSPLAINGQTGHPPIFAAIFRRTKGVRLLDCHAFICTNAKAANSLVRCCFHAYADNVYMEVEKKPNQLGSIQEREDSSRGSTPQPLNNELGENDGDTLKWSEVQKGKKKNKKSSAKSNDFDKISVSSSNVGSGGRYRKKENGVPTARPQSELGGQNNRGSATINQTHWRQRRANSEINLVTASTMPRGGFRDKPMQPVPYFGEPGVPYAGLPGPQPPMMMPYPGNTYKPQVGMRHPIPVFHPEPAFVPMQPVMVEPYPWRPPGSVYHDDISGVRPMHGGTMIRPSVYGTLPRRMIPMQAREEPVYMPGNMPMPPPHLIPPDASYQPASFPANQYDVYFDHFGTNRPQKSNKQKKRTDSRKSGKPPRAQSTIETSSRQKKVTPANDVGSDSDNFMPRPELNYWESNLTEQKQVNGYTTGAVPRVQMDNWIDPQIVDSSADERPPTPPIDYDLPEQYMNGHVKSAVNGSVKQMEMDMRDLSMMNSSASHGKPGKLRAY